MAFSRGGRNRRLIRSQCEQRADSQLAINSDRHLNVISLGIVFPSDERDIGWGTRQRHCDLRPLRVEAIGVGMWRQGDFH